MILQHGLGIFYANWPGNGSGTFCSSGPVHGNTELDNILHLERSPAMTCIDISYASSLCVFCCVSRIARHWSKIVKFYALPVVITSTKLEWWSSYAIKKFNDIFSHFNAMHTAQVWQMDRHTDVRCCISHTIVPHRTSSVSTGNC